MEKPIIGCIFKQKGKSKQKNNKCLLLNNLAECITKGDLYVKLNYGNSIFATVKLSTADYRLKEQYPVAKIVSISGVDGIKRPVFRGMVSR